MPSASPDEQKELNDEEDQALLNVSASALSPGWCVDDRNTTDHIWNLSPQTPADTPPPLPTTPLPDDYYEEAVPLDPGAAPQYFTTNMNSWVKTQVCNPQEHTILLKCCCFAPPASRNSVEDDYYEDADNNYPATRINGAPKSSCESSCWFFKCLAVSL